MLNDVALEEEARAAREGRTAMPVKMVFQSSNLDPRRYNEPTANEVAVVYVGEEGDVPAEHNLAVHLRSGGLHNICAMIHAVKYMYKYVYKGPDRAALRMIRTNGDDGVGAINEIDAFVNARFSGQEEEALRRAAGRDTMLTAYFKLSAEHEAAFGAGNAPQGGVDARTSLYVQLPEHFTFGQRTGKWSIRRKQSRQLGRMYTAHPLDSECYSLRILLLNRKGALHRRKFQPRLLF
ncbi:unnamed protein product [Haemonchus placei]|uniref:Helitron_like_N domain-containing protein n=1 Tax=Haemonchus placei TaxID=6290 RepID=A0A0N4X446_HAEPC|nr:unnamed protein product [Haemonchus placei]